MTKQLRERPPKPKDSDGPTPVATDTADRDSDYKVGFCRPPKHSRFKPGQSGNPKGRPKGSRNLDTIERDVLLKPVKVTEGGRSRTVTTYEAILLGLHQDALGGEIPAIDRLFKLAPSAKAAIEAEIQIQRDQEQNGRDEEVGTLMRMVKYILTAESDEEFEL